jgi:lysophospholipase L1-like esterase
MGKFKNKETTMKKTLIISNFITAILLIGILVIEKYPQRIYNRIIVNSDVKPSSFLDNPNYNEITDFYTVYSGQKNIVMLGNSLTNRISWTELLDREDVANRGIGSDITEGFINRLKFVLNVKPKICFIEGGVNDLAKNINNETIIKNLNLIVDTLQKNNVLPVLITVTYVTDKYQDAKNFNSKIKTLNTQIINLAKLKNIKLIDLNPMLTAGDFLRTEMAIGDGIHYSAKAYIIWKTEINKILEQEKI